MGTAVRERTFFCYGGNEIFTYLASRQTRLLDDLMVSGSKPLKFLLLSSCVNRPCASISSARTVLFYFEE